MNEYDQQAADFLTKTGAKLKITFKAHKKYFDEDTETRDVYSVRLSRGRKSYTFTFGQSIVNQGKEPTAYDILACLTAYDPGSFDEFCCDYGYDTDSRRAEKTYRAVKKEFAGVSRLFNAEEREQLEEIN